MASSSFVEFAADTRIHIGLGVSNRDRSVDFYRVLLGEEPVKVRDGYAKFEPSEPSLNLSLIEHRAAAVPAGPTHYGIQVKSTEAVERMIDRLKKAGLAARVEEQTSCCYAVQTKVWAEDPDGHRWEVFVVLDDASEKTSDADCCPADCCDPSDPNCC